MSISASEFLKWCAIFDVATGGGGGVTFPITMAQGGTGNNLTPTANALFYSTNTEGALLSPLNSCILTTDVDGNLGWNQTLPTGTMAASPSASTQVATKGYVDSAVAGLTPTPPCYAASTTNLTGYTYNNGTAGVGATLTAGSDGAFSIDGVSPPVNSAILYKNDTTGSGAYNGIYMLTTVGDGSTAAVLTRATYYDTPSEINDSGIVPIINGSTQAGSGWLNTSTVVTVGTTPLVYIQFGQFSGILGLGNGGTNAALTASNGGIVYSGATSLQILAATPTALLPLLSGANGAPSWAAFTLNMGGALTTGGTVTTTGNFSTGGAFSTAGAFSMSGAFSFAGTLTGNTSVTFPTSGTLATTSLIPSFPLSLTNGGTNASLTASNGGILYSTSSAVAILGGTSTANLPLLSGSNAAPTWSNFALSLGGALTTAGAVSFSGASSFTGTLTGNTAVTFPTSGTLATTSQLPSLPLSLANGGTGAALTASNGGIFYSTGSAGAILAGTATASQVLLSGSSTTPTWSTATYPATTTANQLVYSSANNVISGLATANSSVLITSSGGVPSFSTTLPSGISATNISLTTPSIGVASGTSVSLSSSAGIVGVTDGSAASAGYVGEVMSNGAAIDLNNGSTTAVTSITLTPGDWDVWASVEFNVDVGTSVTYCGACITNVDDSTYVPALSSLETSGVASMIFTWTPSSDVSGEFLYNNMSIPTVPWSISTNTTLYLNAYSDSSSLMAINAIMTARRVR